MPIVYDPVIAESIENYSELFVNPQNAAYLSVKEPENIETILKNAASDRNIRLIVVTDAEGILGIGDWGTNGVDISVGKLMVYTAAAGIDPSTVLPVVIDAGTNRKELLENEFYLGNKFERVRGDEYYNFIDKFVKTAEKIFPDLYLHWEDFGRLNAANILKNKIAKEKNKLVFITSHILSELEGIVTHIIFMDEGRVLFFKSVQQLLEETGQENVSQGVMSLLEKHKKQ